MDHFAEPGSATHAQDRLRRAQTFVPIGRFSEMTRLTVKALRHYADVGLLDPAHVDPSSGYRYYRLGQANRAEAIRILRQVDMPLEEIAEVLAADDATLVAKQLTRHRERLAARLADDERRLRFLERLIDRGEGVLPYEVELTQTTPQVVAMVRRTTDLTGIAATLREGFGTVVGALGSAPPTGPPFVVSHAVIDADTTGDIDICVPVAADATLAGNGDVARVEVPALLVARTVHRGPYDELGPAYHTVLGWIAERGHQIAGPPREVYLSDPGEVPAPELLTEVQWPVEQEDVA